MRSCRMRISLGIISYKVYQQNLKHFNIFWPTQSANIGFLDVARTSSSNVAGTFPKKILFDHTGYVSERTCKTHPRGRCLVICWMSLNFFLLFFWNLFDWPNLSKSNSILKMYLEPSRTSKMELFCEIS